MPAGVKVYAGNAEADSVDYRGWILGRFVSPSDDVRSTSDLEIKWGVHPRGEARASWTEDEQRTTVLLLVSGTYELQTTEGKFNLTKPGDYVVWGPGVNHSWLALDDSVVVTVRWPSLPTS